MPTADVRVVAILLLALCAVLVAPLSGASVARSAEGGSSDASGGTFTLSPESRTAVVPDGPLERLAGVDRIATAVAVSQRAFPDGADEVVVATAWSFPDALAAAPLAHRGDGPLLLVGDRLDEEVAREIERLGATTAYIPGAIQAVPYVVEVELEEMGLDVVRLAGGNRYDTAGRLAVELGPAPTREVAVASGRTFADALSVGPLAAAAQIPILLSEPDRLPADSRDALRALDPSDVIVLGGSHAISDDVLNGLPSPRRYAGADRYATAATIADLLIERGGTAESVYAATGWSFPDALSAGPVAALGPGPLLLVHGQDPDAADATWRWLDANDAGVDGVIVFGGPHAVEAEVADRLRPYGQDGP